MTDVFADFVPDKGKRDWGRHHLKTERAAAEGLEYSEAVVLSGVLIQKRYLSAEAKETGVTSRTS